MQVMKNRVLKKKNPKKGKRILEKAKICLAVEQVKRIWEIFSASSPQIEQLISIHTLGLHALEIVSALAKAFHKKCRTFDFFFLLSTA